jgi:hypothetical protein
MHTTSIAQLQATLHVCFAWVKTGEEVVVTEHGTPKLRADSHQRLGHEGCRHCTVRPACCFGLHHIMVE